MTDPTRHQRHVHARHPAQAVVEFALVMPALAGIVAVLFQFGVLFLTALSLVHATRDVGRWLAVHPDTTDAQVQAYVAADVPSTLSSANITVTVGPACASLSSGRCTARPSGSALHVTLAYNAASVIFLPTSFNLGFLRTTVPTTLPPYDYYVMVEQR